MESKDQEGGDDAVSFTEGFVRSMYLGAGEEFDAIIAECATVALTGNVRVDEENGIVIAAEITDTMSFSADDNIDPDTKFERSMMMFLGNSEVAGLFSAFYYDERNSEKLDKLFGSYDDPVIIKLTNYARMVGPDDNTEDFEDFRGPYLFVSEFEDQSNSSSENDMSTRYILPSFVTSSISNRILILTYILSLFQAVIPTPIWITIRKKKKKVGKQR